MSIKVVNLPNVEISKWAKSANIEIVISERLPNEHMKECWYANIPTAEIMERGMLKGTVAYGDTPLEALEDLAEVIGHKKLAFNAMTKQRREINVPGLFVTKASLS